MLFFAQKIYICILYLLTISFVFLSSTQPPPSSRLAKGRDATREGNIIGGLTKFGNKY